MTGRARLGLKGFHTQKNQNKNLDVLVDLYYGVVHQHCGRIDKDNIQSSLSICLLRSFPSIALHIPTAHNFTHN